MNKYPNASKLRQMLHLAKSHQQMIPNFNQSRNFILMENVVDTTLELTGSQIPSIPLINAI